jgi:hypothetical protein
MTTYSTGALPRFATAFSRISRVSKLDHPIHSVWTDTYSQLAVERRCCAIGPNDHSSAGAIRRSRACEANAGAYTPFAGTAGTVRRVGPRLRSNAARSRAATLALSVLIASLPCAKASAACQAPPDTFANPFSKESAHHRPIGSGAVFADRNHPSTISLLKSGFNNINSDNGWGTNIYRSTPADPLKTVTQAGPLNSGLPVTLRVPAGASNGSRTDSVVVIVEGGTGIAHQFYQWRWNNGKPTAGIHRSWDTKGPGHAGSRVGTSASGVAGMFGLLRGHEVNTPGYKIQHALQIALDAKGACGMMIKNKFVWPAVSTDGFCKDSQFCDGNIPYGALLALPPNVNIGSLGLSEPGKRLAEALQNYGTYVVDNSLCPVMRGDQNINGSVRMALIRDMKKLYPLLRMVLNNSAGQNASGGGTPRAENCAYNSR